MTDASQDAEPERDAAFMRRALELAARGWGLARPNPMVGAVVVREGEIVGEGWHQAYGGPHAEVNALSAAGGLARGATLYVTLEPCNHYGQTPPCTEAIEHAGIARVVFAASDPNPKASGGAARLREHGIAVTAGVEQQASRDLDPIFFQLHESGKTFVALKYALSLDAKLAARPGARTTITGESARIEARRLRAGYSAVAIGIGTALADDPLLTVPGAARRGTPPVRVVFDSDLRLPRGSMLMQALADAPLWLVCAEDAPEERLRWWAPKVPVLPVPRVPGGLDLAEALAMMRERGLESVFFEGGGRIGTSLLAADLVDWLHMFHAPILLGDEGVPAFPGMDPEASSAVRGAWRRVRAVTFDDDVLMEYRRIRETHSAAEFPGTSGST